MNSIPKKLLVADDSLTIQKVIKLALAHEPYEILSASEGLESIQQVALHHPSLVLIDVALPGKNAFEVKAEINTLPDLHDVGFILMSSAFEAVDEEQVKNLGFAARLTKPFDPAHLRRTLKQAFDASPLIPPPIPQHQEMPALPLVDEESILMPPPIPSQERSQAPLGPQNDEISALTSSTFNLVERGDDPPLPPFDTPSNITPPLPSDENSIELDMSFPAGEEPELPSFAPERAKKSPSPAVVHLTEGDSSSSSLFEARFEDPELASDFVPDEFEPDVSKDFDDPLEEDWAFDTPKQKKQWNTEPKVSDTFTHPPFTPPREVHTGPQVPDWEPIIKKEVQNWMQGFAQKLLPDLAERMIKEEIHKLLAQSEERKN